MAIELFDNAVSEGTRTFLVQPIGVNDTVLPVADIASEALQATNGQFRIIVIDIVSGHMELMLVTGNQWTPNWTVQRGIEGSQQFAFPIGSIVKHILTAGALENLASQIAAAQYTTPASQVNGNYTFQLSDSGTVVEGIAPIAQTFTVPSNQNVPFPVGATLEVFQYGAGRITISAAAGVVLRSHNNLQHTSAQYATIGLRQRAANEWVLSGDLG